MIAIIAHRRDWPQVFPNKKFKGINSINDIGGINFDAVLMMGDWYTDEHRVKAFHALKKRQPELFEDES